MAISIVKWVNPTKNYSFVQPNNNLSNMFVYISDKQISYKMSTKFVANMSLLIAYNSNTLATRLAVCWPS
ncbi:MAG: hypothetical protein FD167_2431 [bacterium]|nr:MAG: hypothetical protein FD167_2431 [bacterium]